MINDEKSSCIIAYAIIKRITKDLHMSDTQVEPLADTMLESAEDSDVSICLADEVEAIELSLTNDSEGVV